jgi:hypothetical protein
MDQTAQSVQYETTEKRNRSFDRRGKRAGLYFRYLLSGRRKSNRRNTDPQSNYYVDQYSTGLFVTALLIVTLSLLDAVFTYIHISHGGQEWNPIMREVLSLGAHVFFPYKYILTALGVFMLCMHKNFTYVRSMLLLILTIYVLLTFYHVTLLYAF